MPNPPAIIAMQALAQRLIEIEADIHINKETERLHFTLDISVPLPDFIHNLFK